MGPGAAGEQRRGGEVVAEFGLGLWTRADGQYRMCVPDVQTSRVILSLAVDGQYEKNQPRAVGFSRPFGILDPCRNEIRITPRKIPNALGVLWATLLEPQLQLRVVESTRQAVVEGQGDKRAVGDPDLGGAGHRRVIAGCWCCCLALSCVWGRPAG